MHTAKDLLIHHPEHGIAVCRAYGYAVFLDHLESHLGKRHPGLSVANRRQICRSVSSWKLFVSTTESAIVLLAIEQPVSGLPLYNDGLQCSLDPS